MSNEVIYATGTVKVLEANGAAIANNALAQADDANYDVIADGGGFPDVEFALTGAFPTAPTEGAVIALYARPLDVDGTLDTEAPETTRPTLFIGNFAVNNVTTTQTIVLRAYDVPLLAAYYPHNNGTGQTLSAGWTLKAKPITKKAAP